MLFEKAEQIGFFARADPSDIAQAACQVAFGATWESSGRAVVGPIGAHS
jgi:hypothetical protein